ncbi:hypothetical protein JHK86_016417 [Glycine max]|nr:hypothetical protein JHK86_016417 [Glycine max]
MVFEMSNEDGMPWSLSSGTTSWLDRVELDMLDSAEIAIEGLCVNTCPPNGRTCMTSIVNTRKQKTLSFWITIDNLLASRKLTKKVQLQRPVPTKPAKTAAKTCICTGPANFTMTLVNLAGQFGDTTYTKVFVGGLA